jgi:hypothetical protein
MKRTREITITHYRRRVKKGSAAEVEACPVCGSTLGLITIESAAKLTGLNLVTLYSWIASNQIQTASSLRGEFLICRRSLFE